MQILTGMVLLPGNATAESVRRAIYLVQQKIRWGNNPVSLSICHIENDNGPGLPSVQYLSVQTEEEEGVSEDTLGSTLDKIDYFMSGYFSSEKLI
jgi:hypothetical protein